MVPIKDLGLPPGHPVDAIMSTATMSGSPISGPVGVIYDQVGTGTGKQPPQ